MKTEEVKEKEQTNRKYLSYVAERIATERPSAEIILQTLMDTDERGFGRGYVWRGRVTSKFKEFQRKRRDESWNSVKDNLDDMVHKNCEAVTNPNEA